MQQKNIDMTGIPPLVSIGLPVYNGERFLREALDSLLAQEHRHFELIISDNASTDETPQICAEYAARDSRIRYIRRKNNEGAVNNFNLVLKLAEGDFFMWAASDDLWEATYISSLLRLLTADAGAVLAFCALDNIDESGEQVKTYTRLFELASPDLFQRLLNYIRQAEQLGKPNIILGLMRRDTIQTAGGFKIWGSFWAADMLVVFRLLSLGNIVFARELLFHKRVISAPHDETNRIDMGRPQSRARVISAPRDETKQGKLASFMKRTLRIISMICSMACGWVHFFYGYTRIIRMLHALTARQKAKLQTAIWTRAGQLFWEHGKMAVILLLRKVRMRYKK